MWRLTMTRGNTPTIRFRTTDSDGNTADLTGMDVYFVGARNYGDVPLFEKTVGDGITISPGTVLVRLDAADTEDLSDEFISNLVWEFQVDDGTDIETYAKGQLIVEPNLR